MRRRREGGGIVIVGQLSEVIGQLGHIFFYIVLPILLMAGIGWFLQKKFSLDMTTLRRLNFHFVIPCLIYHSIVTAKISAGHIGQIAAFAAAMLVGNGLITYLVARLRAVKPDQRNTMLMTTMLHNSGNYGLPLQELAYGPVGLSLQVFYMLAQNLAHFTIGVLLAAGGQGVRTKQTLIHIAKFPPLYAIAAGLVTVLLRGALGEQAPSVAAKLEPFWRVVVFIRGAFVPVTLCTLGAQLGLLGRTANKYPITVSVLLRLLVAPMIGLCVIYALGLRGIMAQVMLVASCTPTSVNSMLLCLEFDNHPDYAARAVFYSTLFSPITVTLVIFLAQGNLLPMFGR